MMIFRRIRVGDPMPPRYNSRCCEITPTVLAAAKKLNLIITANARHSSDYSVEMGQGILVVAAACILRNRAYGGRD
jgi:hypothetical protein